MILLHFIFFFAFGIESGKIQPNFDEIFSEEWDKKECERKVVNIEQNERNENSQSAAVDQMGEYIIKRDQNTKEEPNEQMKRELIQKFEAIKGKLKQKGKYQWKNNNKIECKIAKLLGANREKIYKWKKELNLNKKNIMKKSFYVNKKKEFIERFDEFKELYGQGKQKEFVKELGINEMTFLKWKKELVPNYYKSHMKNKYSNEDKSKKMKEYFEIKERSPKISNERIAKKFGISRETLRKWKKEYISDLI